VLDEHLWHASAGGRDRRQGRVDYFADPAGAGAPAERDARGYISDTFPPDWDGGYDGERYPTYGPHFLASGRPSVERLRALGAVAAAHAQEGTRARNLSRG